jgi:hypothetical protein
LLLPHGNTVGNGTSQQVLHWSSSFGIQAKIAVLGVTFQQALAFQVTANAPGLFLRRRSLVV